MTPVIGGGDRNGLPDAFGTAPLPLFPPLMPGDEGGAGDAGRGERDARDDEQERTPTAAHIGPQSVEQVGGRQQARVPDDQGTRAFAQGEGECPSQLVGIMDPDAHEMWQVDTEGGRARRIETVVGIEEQDGMDAGDCGKKTMQERRDTRPLGAGEEMGVAERQSAQERIERRQTGREQIGVRREVRGPADGKRGRERGKRWR